MGRSSRFTREQLVGQAVEVAAEQGPDAVSMLGVAKAVGAPSGSMYHRFDSRPQLLGEVWQAALEAFQDYWWVRAKDEQEAGNIAVVTLHWARHHRSLARVLLLHSVDRFVIDECPAAIRDAINGLQQRTAKQLREMAQRFLGHADARAVERTTFALANLPIAAIRRPLKEGRPITQYTESLVHDAATCLMTRTHHDR